MASISFTNISTTSIGAYISGLDTEYERNDRYIEWYNGQDSAGTASLAAHASNSSTKLFSGLRPGTRYSIRAIIHYSSTPTSGLDRTVELSSICKTEEEAATRPSYFSWDTAKTSGAEFKLTASEWNRLISNINSVRSYLGYSSASFTKAVAGNEFTAAMFNQARSAIISISGFSGYISQATSGGKVYANMLNALQSGINGLG